MMKVEGLMVCKNSCMHGKFRAGEKALSLRWE